LGELRCISGVRLVQPGTAKFTFASFILSVFVGYR
jgi:hypothetical protein